MPNMVLLLCLCFMRAVWPCCLPCGCWRVPRYVSPPTAAAPERKVWGVRDIGFSLSHTLGFPQVRPQLEYLRSRVRAMCFVAFVNWTEAGSWQPGVVLGSSHSSLLGDFIFNSRPKWASLCPPGGKCNSAVGEGHTGNHALYVDSHQGVQAGLLTLGCGLWLSICWMCS